MFLMETPGHLDLSDEGFDIQWGTNVVGECLTHTCRPLDSQIVARSILFHKIAASCTSGGCCVLTRWESASRLHYWALYDREYHAGYCHRYCSTGVGVPASAIRPIKAGMYLRRLRLCTVSEMDYQANVILAREFARRYGEKGLVSVSVNPGMSFLPSQKLTNNVLWIRNCPN